MIAASLILLLTAAFAAPLAADEADRRGDGGAVGGRHRVVPGVGRGGVEQGASDTDTVSVNT